MGKLPKPLSPKPLNPKHDEGGQASGIHSCAAAPAFTLPSQEALGCCLGFQGLGFRCFRAYWVIWSLGFRVKDLGFKGLGFQGLGFRVSGFIGVILGLMEKKMELL